MLGPLPFSRLVKLPWPLVKVRIVGRVTANDILGVISLSLRIRICALSAPDSLFTHALLIRSHLLTFVLSVTWMILDRVIPFVRIALIAVISCGLPKFAACGMRSVLRVVSDCWWLITGGGVPLRPLPGTLCDCSNGSLHHHHSLFGYSRYFLDLYISS